MSPDTTPPLDQWPACTGLITLEETDSTMAEARRRLPEVAGPTWIHARHQTAARGRRGRAWAMPKGAQGGNLAATLILPSQDPPERLALRSFLAALALFDACVALTGQPAHFALKWPNDVLMQGGKLAGILLESLAQGVQPQGVAIGFGVNLAQAPAPSDLEPEALRPVALAALARVSPEDLLIALAAAFAHREAQFQAQGFAPLREAWLARAAKLGQEITARTVTKLHHGTFETVDMTGALVLTTPNARQVIPAADVYF